MIITVTPNPSLDRTVTLAGALHRGEVHRLNGSTVEAGGKGVNVARVLHGAQREVLTLLPAHQDDPILGLLEALALPVQAVPVTERVRTNITVTEPDGTTTKLNEAGAVRTQADQSAFANLILDHASRADWVVLAGSLPPGFDEDWYAQLVPQIVAKGARVAVDTSDAPLIALAEAFPEAAPHLIKPNSDELAQISGANAHDLEAAAARGEVDGIVEAARTLTAKGVETVLVTLGAAGAVLVQHDGAWRALPPPITVQSTVGAGDSSVAGFLMAAQDGLGPEACLALAVAYGAGAASLAGTTLPRPDQVNPEAVSIEPC